MNLHCILQTARKMYVREQSQEENFQGKNLNHAPFVPVSDNRMYKIYKSLLQRAFHHSHRRAQHHTEESKEIPSIENEVYRKGVLLYDAGDYEAA